MKKRIVLSLGGSLIVPKNLDVKFLKKFKDTIQKHYKNYKFIVVCGGGTIARKYIKSLKAENKPKRELSLAGIRATRMNARFMMQLFGKEANDKLPKNMKEVEDALPKNKIVFCGALRFTPNSTSDGTAAKLAKRLKTEFINMTDVNGLYTSNPKTNKKAKKINKITWKKFRKMANKTRHKPGQHFVLDQNASKTIEKEKIKTYILGPNLKNFSKLLNGNKFIGTTISE